MKKDNQKNKENKSSKKIKKNNKQVKKDNKVKDNKKKDVKKVASKKNKEKVVSKNKKDKVVSKKNVKTKKQNNNKTKILILTIVITISLSLIAASYYVLENPKFNLQYISAEGNNKIDINDIISKTNIKSGENIIKSIFKFSKTDILSLPYVSDVSISVKLPSEIVFKIVERESKYFAFDKEKNVYYKLDENGIILEKCESINLKENELLVSGVTFDNIVVLGSKINEIDYTKILVFERVQTEFSNVIEGRNITKVDFANSLTTIYINDKIEVILPNDTNLKYNMNFLNDIIKNIGNAVGTIDMTKDNPTFINL